MNTGKRELHPSERDPSPAVGRALTVLETLVASDGGLTLSALAAKTDIPLATCAAIVYTLERRGYASRRIVGRSHFWRATLGLYGLAVQLTRKVDLATVAQVEMQALAENLGMPVHIGVLNGPNVVYVAKAASPGFIQFDTYPGKIAPFNLTALGKAITAFLPEVELEALLPHLVPGRGPRALPAGRDAYLSDLATIRRKGFAVENEEDEEKIACVAVPFFDAEASVAGAVGVTGFARDMTGVTLRRAREQLVDLGAHISRRLGFDPGRTAGHTS